MFEKIFANRWVHCVLAAICLCLAVAFAVVVTPPAAFAEEPAPDANPCLVECKSNCYAEYAEAMNWCSDPEWAHDPETCELYYLGTLAACKFGCESANQCEIWGNH